MLARKPIRFMLVLLAFFAMAGGVRAAPTWSSWTTTVSGGTQNFATLSGYWSDPDISSVNSSWEFGVAVDYNPTQLLLTQPPQPPAGWALYAPDTGQGQGYLVFSGPSQYFAQYDVEGIGSGSSPVPFNAVDPQLFSLTFQILAAPSGDWTSDPITLSFVFDYPVYDSSSAFTITRSSDYVLSPVPEPETYAMMLAGLGLLGFMARRRTRKVASA